MGPVILWDFATHSIFGLSQDYAIVLLTTTILLFHGA